MVRTANSQHRWTFLTNHALVLVVIARDPGIRMRDIAGQVGITERAAQRIVAELVEEGYVKRIRVGRRNNYEIQVERSLRHPEAQHADVRGLLGMLLEKSIPSSGA